MTSKRREFDRLGEKLLGALFDRPHRQVDGAVRRQNDQRCDSGSISLRRGRRSRALPSGSM